jgi:hypothetical protein
MPPAKKQTDTERAWRIRQLSRGVNVPDATAAERRAASKRKREQAQRGQADRESGAG